MKRRALLIGCNYIGSSCELSGCINDIHNIKLLLEKYHKVDEIRMLRDDSSSTHEIPTMQNMMECFDWFVSGLESGDALYLHYSGHGGQTKDKSGDELDGKDEVIYNCDFYEHGSITDDLLRQKIVDRLPSGVNLFAVFDSCHSGSVLDLKYNYKSSSIRPFVDPHYGDSAAQVICISGCMDQQTSADTVMSDPFTHREQNQGALTGHFIQALINNCYSETSGPSLIKLIADIRNGLKADGYSQYPVLSTGRMTNLGAPIKLL
jgi:hypothetical protein